MTGAEAECIYVLRARKRSSERMAMPFIRRTATVNVSTKMTRAWTGVVCTVKKTSEAEEDHCRGFIAAEQ